jgi:hypothetical protein
MVIFIYSILSFIERGTRWITGAAVAFPGPEAVEKCEKLFTLSTGRKVFHE